MTLETLIPLHVSKDIETLGTSNNAVILSIGAAFLTEERVYPNTFHVHLEVEPQLKLGRVIEWQTVLWWMGWRTYPKEEWVDMREAQQRTFSAKRTSPLNALQLLKSWWRRENDAQMPGDKRLVAAVWANGPSFDTALIESLARQLDFELPWRYNQPRDLRTIKDFLNKDEMPEFSGTPHVAVDDALYQAEIIRRGLCKMKGKPVLPAQV